jgi:predicted metal-binding membrane protein
MTGGATPPTSLAERVARNERRAVWLALAVVAFLGLVVTLRAGDALMAPSASDWSQVDYAATLFVMWWSMMLAMMLPSAAPAILTYGAVSRKFAQAGASPAPVGWFAAGYAMIWTGFSLAAVILQLLTRDIVPLTGMMAVTSGLLGGVLLLAAGLYQMSPLKNACLKKCQSPLMYFARHWRSGRGGAFRMGLSHGVTCLGCCWVLMGLLFYGGVMELGWIVGIAAYVAAEKLIPVGHRLSHLAGVFLAVWGLWTCVRVIN